MNELLSAEGLLQVLVSVTAILFGLFGVFLTGYEAVCSHIGKRWVAYLVLSLFMGPSVFVGSIASLFAFWSVEQAILPFGLTAPFALELSKDMLQLLIFLEAISVPTVGLAYLLVRKK